MASVNLAVRFGLELCLLGVAAWWGAGRGGVPAAIAVPLVVAVVWGMFVAPKARVRVGEAGRAAVETALFLGGVWALVNLGHPVLAVAFGAAALTSGVLERVLTQPGWAQGV